MPISNPNINNGSTIAATHPDETVTIIERTPSPSARKTADPIIPRAIIGNEGTEINKKAEADSNVAPSAPIEINISLRKINKNTTVIKRTQKVSIAKTEVCLRASSQFSAPKDLDTNAVAAIINAIPTDIVKN